MRSAGVQVVLRSRNGRWILAEVVCAVAISDDHVVWHRRGRGPIKPRLQCDAVSAGCDGVFAQEMPAAQNPERWLAMLNGLATESLVFNVDTR